MSDRAIPMTFGEELISAVGGSETKGLIFALLQESVKKHHPQIDLSKYLRKVSDFNSVATYQAKLAKIRIEYNGRAVKEIQDKLVSIKDKAGDRERMIKKLNLLIHNNPTLDEIIYICMAKYVADGYGSVEKFKTEMRKFIKETA